MGKKKHRGNPGRSASPKLGATYQAAKLANYAASAGVNAAIQQGFTQGAADQTFARMKETAFIKGAAVSGLDFMVSRKIHHANALSRKSLTAWAPEVFAIADTAIAAREGSPGWPGHYARVKTGFAPGVLQGFQPIDKTMLYFGGKVLGGVIRKLSTAGPLRSASAPVKKILGSMGGAL